MVPPARGMSSEIESFWYIYLPRLQANEGPCWTAQALSIDMCVFRVIR
jgi:hypothetical protein